MPKSPKSPKRIGVPARVENEKKVFVSTTANTTKKPTRPNSARMGGRGRRTRTSKNRRTRKHRHTRKCKH